MQYYVICNLLYNFVFYQHTLWRYEGDPSWLKHSIIEIAFTLIVVPIMILVYLHFFPSGIKGLAYIAAWALFFWITEVIFNKRGNFIYENGWNIWWSLLFNMIMFPVLRIHYKKPLFAIIISIPIIFLLLLFFHPSLGELK
ncbi:CBO0543 family protein [uncultured Metabacillus sp.]|uniref:CBO0543 family protein n=1 Tax=uncultured Metabacillus sp. TaxID=2860135 RepID=UPI0034575352